MPLVPTPSWSEDELAQSAETARNIFRDERIQEPIETYSDYFEQYRDFVENILEESEDLKNLADVVEDYITDDDNRYALRYLASPAISDDDLRVLAEAKFSKKALEDDPDSVRRIVETVIAVHDRQRLPWVGENREPTDEERRTAVIATTALIASSRAQTHRRTNAKELQ